MPLQHHKIVTSDILAAVGQVNGKVSDKQKNFE